MGKKIGEMLIGAGLIKEKELKIALEEQEKSGGRLCYNLIKMGSLTPDDLISFLSEQFGVAAINLSRYKIASSTIKLIPADFAYLYHVIPINLLNDTLAVAMADPSNENLIRSLEEMTSYKIEPLISPESVINEAIAVYYNLSDEKGVLSSDLHENILILGDEKKDSKIYLSKIPKEGLTSIEWIKKIILEAIKNRSREIHFEPRDGGINIRFRHGDVLVEGISPPQNLLAEITNQIQLLAKLDPKSKFKIPRDGRMKLKIKRRIIAVIVSTFPIIYGERIVMKLLDEKLLCKEFKELGMCPEEIAKLEEMIEQKKGLFIITAPPGNGKMTSLYSILHKVRSSDKNIITVENAIRFPLKGINQTQIRSEEGLTFYNAMRSILRQTPDVLAITEVQDRGVANLLFKVASECLVIAILDSSDSTGVLNWLLEMRIPSTTVASILKGIMAQRLVGKVCKHCKTPYEKEWKMPDNVRGLFPEKLVFYKGQGCSECEQTGFSGKEGIFELMLIKDAVKELIEAEAPSKIIRDEAVKEGMQTLREVGIRKAIEGTVEVGEILDVTYQGSDIKF